MINNFDELTPQDKFEILLHIYKKSYKADALTKLITKYNLDYPKYEFDPEVPSYVITAKEIDDIFTKEVSEDTLSFDDKLEIVEFLNKNIQYQVVDVMDMANFHEAVLANTTKTRASLKIQDGCDNRCAYCIIPFARGKSRSANSKFIIEQINSFEISGFMEVVFTGIHIGQWGKEWGKSILDLFYSHFML